MASLSAREDAMLTRQTRLLCIVALIAGVGFQQKGYAAEFDPIHHPDKYAWQLFIELSHPAHPSEAGLPDPDKQLGEPGDTVWETWALAKRDVFKDGCLPGEWGNWMGQALVEAPSARDPISKADLVQSILEPDRSAKFFFDPTGPFSETRMNQAAYEFIKDNGLYSLEGQEKYHREHRLIDLPIPAMEIKSAWRVLTPEEAQSGRFHTNTADGNTFGLIALHIITKDLPEWFWATFEHVDNPDIDIRDVDRDIRWLDRHTNGGDPDKLPPEIKGTKWENYRLKGTQTDFVTLDGRPTLLANAIIERGFMSSSSCVSCHARATIGSPPPECIADSKERPPECDDECAKKCKVKRSGNRLPVFKDTQLRFLDPKSPQDPNDPTAKRSRFIVGWTGAPDPTQFFERDQFSQISAKRKYTQTDFMWSFIRAKSEKNCER